jgi:large subunit ribosomal protein L6
MSRIGKLPITIPQGTQVAIDKTTGTVSVTGNLGSLSEKFPAFVSFEQDGDQLFTKVQDSTNKFQRSMWGTARSIVNNLVKGVSEGFSKEVTLSGVGFRMELGSELTLHIGFSHPVKVAIPKEVTLKLEKNTLSGTSYSKQVLGDFFTYVHNLKPADPYKHKGFKFPGRFYIKKEGKRGAK